VTFLTAHARTASTADALRAVDEALLAVSIRRLFTPDEAHQLFRSVEDAVADDELRAEIAAVLERAEAGFGGQLMVDRDRVLDPLLDVRLLLAVPRP